MVVRWVWAVAMSLVLGTGSLSVVQAAEETREYDFDLSKGIVLFNSERYGEAERYLSEALKAKPGDPTAGYYLGQSLLRLKRYQPAEERFREILRRHPDDARARMGLGMALYHQERYTDALANLTMAEQTLTDEPLLYYYEGLAAADRQSFDQASEKFLRAGKLDPEFGQDPHYQRGAELYAQGKAEQAAAEFQSAVRAGSSAPIQAKPALGASLLSPSKRWSASFGTSLQYDSNVVLLPGGVSAPGGATGISRKDDFRMAFNGAAEYRMFQNETWTIGAGGGLYKSFHFRLSDFDVLDVAPTLYAQRQIGSMQLRFQYILDYVTVGGDPYLLSNALQTALTVPQSDRSFTQAFVRYQYKDFKTFRDDQLGAPINQTRDGVNWMLGAMQYLTFAENRGQVRAGYIFDTDRTGGGEVTQFGRPTHADWSYTGHRFSTGMAYRPMEATRLDLALDYYRQNYDSANSFSPSGAVRKDNVIFLTGTAVRDLNAWLWVAFQYSFTRDQSNVEVFDYTRHIVSFTLGGTF